MAKKYQICKRCVMDTSDPQITFSSEGYCNHCEDYLSMRGNQQSAKKGLKSELKAIVEEIKQKGKGKEYDCLIGLSGGVDSSYLAYLAVKEYGLRPLAVHLDNGWNSKLAVKNINNTIISLDIDLHTHVIDWNEFKELQLAYLRSSVIDIEVPTDHAIRAALYKTAEENGIEYLLRGYNRNTESIIPKAWTFLKIDRKNLLDINKKHGKGTLNTYPIIDSKRISALEKNGLKTFAPLNYIDFNQEKVEEIIKAELKWKSYGGKHHESVFTRFYQGYILPKKFGIDKRRAHLSTEICNEILSRDEALSLLKESPYDEEQLKLDYDYVVKKFDLTSEEFDQIMAMPIRSHFDYETEMKSKIRKKVLDPRNPVYRFFKQRRNLK